MNLELAHNRCSATDVLMPYRGWVFPTSTPTTHEDRLAVSYMYNGINVYSTGWAKQSGAFNDLFINEDIQWLYL